MNTPQISGVSPVVPVKDVPASAKFYAESLGFDVTLGQGSDFYALVSRGPLMIGLIKAADATALEATASNISAQLWVEDLDALWSEIQPRSEAFPGGPLGPPVDRDYGVRELHVKDPDGFLMIFTQIDRQAA